MGLLNLIPGMKENPFGQWLDQSQNWRGALGAGLAGGKTFEEGLSRAAQLGPAGMQLDKSEAERQAELQKAADTQTKTLDYLQQKHPDLYAKGQAGFPIAELWNEALERDRPKAPVDPTSSVSGREQLAQQYGLQGDDATRFILTGNMPGGNQSVRAGLGQPVPLRNKTTGETVPFMPMSDGTYINPLSQQLANEEWEFDPSYIAAQRAAGTKLGEGVGAAQFNLPQAQMTVTQTKEAINRLRNDTAGMAENFGSFLGVPNQMTPTWPQSKKADFLNNLLEAQGKAFLQARDMLKGGGQITDYEGQKAEQAITRMEAAAKSGSEQAFKTALDDFEAAVDAGYQKIQAQSSMLPQAGQAPGGAIDPSSMSDEELLKALGG